MLSISATAFAAATKVPIADVSESKDHPLLKRYDGFIIIAHQYKSYDEYTIPLSKLMAGHNPSVGFTLYAPKESKTVKGPDFAKVWSVK